MDTCSVIRIDAEIMEVLRSSVLIIELPGPVARRLLFPFDRSLSRRLYRCCRIGSDRRLHEGWIDLEFCSVRRTSRSSLDCGGRFLGDALIRFVTFCSLFSMWYMLVLTFARWFSRFKLISVFGYLFSDLYVLVTI